MTTHGFEHRIARLERGNRLLLVLFLVAGGAVAWAPARQEVLQASSIQLVDDRGRTRMVLSAGADGPSVRLLDENGVARASLADDAEGTALYLRDDQGTIRVGVAQFAHGGGGFALHGPESKGAAVLYLKGDGSLTFFDGDGSVQARFPGG